MVVDPEVARVPPLCLAKQLRGIAHRAPGVEHIGQMNNGWLAQFAHLGRVGELLQSLSVPERQGAINVGKGGRPRRASMPGRPGGGGGGGRPPQQQQQPPAPPAAAAPAGA